MHQQCFGPPRLSNSFSVSRHIRAAKVLPIGVVYAVFTGIGTIGTVVVDAIFVDEGVKPVKLVLIFALLGFIIGLKLSEKGGTP